MAKRYFGVTLLFLLLVPLTVNIYTRITEFVSSGGNDPPLEAPYTSSQTNIQNDITIQNLSKTNNTAAPNSGVRCRNPSVLQKTISFFGFSSGGSIMKTC